MTIEGERRNWVATRGTALAGNILPMAAQGAVTGAVPSYFAWLGDDDCLVAVGRPGEKQIDLDRGLAYGVAVAGDRELVLVLPKGTAEPTRRRLPWLDIPVRVFEFSHDLSLSPVAPLAGAEVLDLYVDELVTDAHSLGDRAEWVERLAAWADAVPELIGAHRSSYLAWHCRGRKVLGIRRSRASLTVTAGVHSTKAGAAPHKEVLTGPISAAGFHRVIAAASEAIADRLAGADTANGEHQLQERVAELRAKLGLRVVLREFPAMRPVGQRGYLDFLGVGRDGRLHVVETKIGPDPMLVLQGLDYWIWTRPHQAELVGYLNSEHEADLDLECGVVIDFVVGTEGGQAHHPHTASHAMALDGSIPWRFHTITQWDTNKTEISSSTTRTPPPSPAGGRRYVERLQAHLATDAGDALTRRVYFAMKGGGIVPEAASVYNDLAERGLLHRHVDHVRSSQAFALNLFGGLDDEAVSRLWSLIDPAVIVQRGIEFEYTDPEDALGECQPNRPHRTQVDVVLSGETSQGARHLAFIEVKLSETAFGACSAFGRDENDSRRVCQQPGAWGGDPSGCFQLRNHGTSTRRQYDTVLDPTWISATTSSGCEFLELNQPMRNVALARSLIERDEAEVVAFCLCAPIANRNVWRQWARARETFAAVPAVTLVDLRADVVAALHPPSRHEALLARYQLREN